MSGAKRANHETPRVKLAVIHIMPSVGVMSQTTRVWSFESYQQAPYELHACALKCTVSSSSAASSSQAIQPKSERSRSRISETACLRVDPIDVVAVGADRGGQDTVAGVEIAPYAATERLLKCS